MEIDNVARNDVPGFDRLNIVPRSIEEILPSRALGRERLPMNSKTVCRSSLLWALVSNTGKY
jgi:hypothetical protein